MSKAGLTVHSKSASGGGSGGAGPGPGPVSFASTFGSSVPVLLFSDLLADSHLLSVFRSYLTANFAIESLLFWTEVQGYKAQPESDFRSRTAAKIYTKFLKPDAKMAITYLGAEIRGHTQARQRLRRRGGVQGRARTRHDYADAMRPGVTRLDEAQSLTHDFTVHRVIFVVV